MKNTIKKPTFKEIVAVTAMGIPDVGLTFNAQKVGPMKFNGLINADYGKGFRMPTMPELVPLVYTSLENQEYETAKNVIKTLKNHWLIGNTAIHYFPEGMFVQDNPEMKNEKIIIPDYKTLENKLGKYEEKGVVFSDDKSIRFTPYNFKGESQSSFELSKNTGIIALVSGEENSEKLAMASGHYKINPYFGALSNVNLPQTGVAVLFSDGFDFGLVVGAGSSESDCLRCSFGVCEKDAEGVAL
ncbi:MAG: hypothetical protein ABIE36_03725 [Candidatus Diapherotrites archaeon]